MSSNQVQEKPKVVPIIHERPKMPAKTWSALRAHIQAERKKKREEEGKQKEEERLKRERESKKKQEANNLEETKEQIAMLEEKLSSLKEEKHQLFLTLKKVLNEDDVRRRKESSEMNSMFPQSHASNVLPMSGHIVQPSSSSRYIQPGQGHQQRQSIYMKPGMPAGLPPIPHALSVKRGRSPSPPQAYPQHFPPTSSRAPTSIFGMSSGPGYPPPPLVTTQAANNAARDLLKEAVSQGLGLGIPPHVSQRERELLASSIGQRDILSGMGSIDREMFAKGLAGLGAGGELPPLNLAASAASSAVAKETETYARYLATFQQQLEAGNKTAVAAAALSELDRARMVNAVSAASQPRPGYYQDLAPRAFPSPR